MIMFLSSPTQTNFICIYQLYQLYHISRTDKKGKEPFLPKILANYIHVHITSQLRNSNCICLGKGSNVGLEMQYQS